MLELYLEHQIVSSTFHELAGARMSLQKMLDSKKGDIEIMSAIRNIENDLEICRMIIMMQKPAIIAALEAKYKVNFKFLVDVPKSHPDGVAQMKSG